MEVRPSSSFCIHNIFNAENGIVGARTSACTFHYLVCFLCQVVGCTIADNCASNKTKNSNAAGAKLPPDAVTTSLSAQFPRM